MTSSPSLHKSPFSVLEWTLRFGSTVHIPLWGYALAEVLQGHIEPLIGGPFENLVVMLAMSSFYAAFFLGPSLLLHFRRKKSQTQKEELSRKDAHLLGLLGGFVVLLGIHHLPLNALEPWTIGGLLVLSGATSALAVHVVGSLLLSQKNRP